MRISVKSAVMSLASTVLLAVVAAPALAVTNSFGPQSWSEGTATARYRAHAGTHWILPSNGCRSGYYENVELRVDVINQPDIREGYYAALCGYYNQYPGNYDSYNTAFRGHFMQNHTYNWYGSLTDSHS